MRTHQSRMPQYNPHDSRLILGIVAAATCATYLLRRRARRVYHEGYADGYVCGASDRINGNRIR